MAYKRTTIVRMMVEDSGKTAEEVSEVIGKEPDYVSRVISGEERRPTANTLALIAKECGYVLTFVGHGKQLDFSAYLPPREAKSAEFDGTYDSEFTGKSIAITGALYGLDDESKKRVVEALGAEWHDGVKVRSTNFLVMGSDFDPENPFGQYRKVKGAKKTVTEIIDADTFRKKVLEATGFDIAAK